MHGVLLAQVRPTMVNHLASITCAFTKVLHALNVEYKLIQKLVVLLSTQCIYYLHTRCVINSLTAYM